MANFTPENWFWKSEDDRFYSSARQAVIEESDVDYAGWLAAGNLPTPWPHNEMGEQTESALATVLEVYGLRLFEPTLNEIKTDLKTLVDEAAETERLRYITAGSGQAMTYQEKVSQAVAYSKAWFVHLDNPDNVAAPKMAEYPLLAASLGIDGDTLLEVAETVTFAYALWQQIGAAIEATRLLAKVAIDEAETAQEAQMIFDAVQWPTPQILEGIP